MLFIRLIPVNSHMYMLVALASLLPALVVGQDRVIVVRHGSTPEGDIIRARADAILLLRQAQLTAEKVYAQRLENLIRECDVVYKRFSTRNEMRKEVLDNKYERTFDIIRFNQQLADIREQLEHKVVMQHTRIGDLTGGMNHLLEAFTRQSLTASGIPAMKTELTSEQLDAIFLTDGSNTFSGKTGKTRLEAFKWPFLIQRKDFQQERDDFDRLCDEAVKEIDANKSPSPETIGDLLKQADAIDKKLDALPLSDSQNVRAVENKWRKEAKDFTRELTRTLGNCSRLDSEKLSKYVFQGKTLGELIDHLNSKGLRFSHPSEQDANLYAAIFFIMRYAYQEYGAANDATDKATSDTPTSERKSSAAPHPMGGVRSPLLAVAPFNEKTAKQHQARWAKHLHVPVVQTNSIGMKLALIPPGEFDMGSPQQLIDEEVRLHSDDGWYRDHIPSEGPLHRVRITKPYWLGATEVTLEEYQRVMGRLPSRFASWNPQQGDPKRPVNISWDDAMEFCRKLS